MANGPVARKRGDPSRRPSQYTREKNRGNNRTGLRAEAQSASGSSDLVHGQAPAKGDQSNEPFADRVVINHGGERRLELTLVQGDITQVDASCYVVGLFKAVAPGGAAAALDRAMNGRISELVARRMFGADVGEISVLPNGRRAMRAPNVAFVGLGSFDSFRSDTLTLVCDNLVRTFVAAGLDDFAMVPFGWSSVDNTAESVRAMLVGFVRAIKDSDPDFRFRGLSICEMDRDRFASINDQIHDLALRESFADLELVIRVVRLPELAAEPTRSAMSIATPRIYLMAREVPQEGTEAVGVARLMMSVLTSGDKAAIIMDEQPGSAAALENLLNQVENYGQFPNADALEFSERLTKLLIADGVAKALDVHKDCHLVVVHDASASRIPWETLRIGGQFPALVGGLSHRYEASDLSVAKWLQCRRQDDTLSVLLVVDPNNDLPGAECEGDRIKKVLGGLDKAVTLDELKGDAATKNALLTRFSSGRYDIVHYAGHAFFDPQQRGRSGVFCARREVLSGLDLATIDNLPTLMFFNACEAARVRGPGAAVAPADKFPDSVQGGVGFAEALLRGGIANFIGTYWPVNDDAASAFASQFYPALLEGATLNDALLQSRLEVRKLGTSQDWANYVFYGDPDFRLKLRTAAATAEGGSNGH